MRRDNVSDRRTHHYHDATIWRMVDIYFPAESADSMSNGLKGDVSQGSRLIDWVRAISLDFDEERPGVHFPRQHDCCHTAPLKPDKQCFLSAAEQCDRSDWR
jgi:hypothetical protein